MEIITLIENNLGKNQNLKNEFGLSFFIKDNDIELIFDTGQTGLFFHNFKELNIVTNDIKHIVLSHSHYDHTGGLKTFIENSNKDFTLYITPKFFQEKYRIKPEIKEFLGNNFDLEYLEKNNIDIKYIFNGFKISKNIVFFTDFKSYFDFEPPAEYYFRKIEDSFILDHMNDELVIGLDTPKGMVLICGCSHIGICNIIESITNETGKNIYGVIGGLHLSRASDERIEKTAQYFMKKNIKFLAVSHCTGEKALNYFKNLDINLISNNTGDKIIF